MSTFFKLAMALVLAVAGWQHYKKSGRVVATDAPAEASASRGFVSLPAFPGSNGRAVVIFAPENCPEDAGRRADALADALSRSGVPVSRLNHVGFNVSGPDEASRINAVMNGSIPIVVVRGRGKANPSLDEVLAEYSAAR